MKSIAIRGRDAGIGQAAQPHRTASQAFLLSSAPRPWALTEGTLGLVANGHGC
ncbi:MAG: hypothetical protein ACM3ML_05510 [Micromonosporaceae bacterium]